MGTSIYSADYFRIGDPPIFYGKSKNKKRIIDYGYSKNNVQNMVQAVLFEDIFDVRVLNENGKKFEKVNRVHSKGTTYDVDLVLDVNAELFDVRAGERISLAIASTLSLDGTPDDGSFQMNMGPSLLDSYDYAMHGRVFSIKHVENQNIEVQASFGGLLCRLRGEQSQLEALQCDMMIYILMRKGGSDLSVMD